ncbi:type II toxin-antitoxin system VapC family toxin [Candidatus Bathyarchaeota archaeon]|nr:MAG: type II toxin-antitoxin system VapC family toxin [Candidatus Bathyarchaeota archaeon]
MKVVDSTFLISLLRNEASTVRKAEELDEEGGAATTVINIYETMYGVFRSMNMQNKRLDSLKRIIVNLDVLDLNYEAACKAAEIAGTLGREGRGIDPFDSLIAGITLTYGAEALITRNTTHFERIPGLLIETH